MGTFHKTNGPAGHGKTYALVQAVKAAYNAKQRFVLVTPTNKAAMVLNARLAADGLPELAATLHSIVYRWVNTGNVKAARKTRVVDPDTGKFRVDASGQPVYNEEIEYEYIREISDKVNGCDIYVDESSMVASDVWRDLIEYPHINNIYTFGDERQLPPIEVYDRLDQEVRPYYKFWHQFNDADHVTTLSVNHRQAGDLKLIVEAIERSLFNRRSFGQIPTDLFVGCNFTANINNSAMMSDDNILSAIMAVDMIITPYNKIREIVNTIKRRVIAATNRKQFSLYPVENDQIIFVDALKEDIDVNSDGKNRVKRIAIAKNVCATITKVHDFDDIRKPTAIVVDLIDELGYTHKNVALSLQQFNNEKNRDGFPRVNYAYAVTVHSSQGASWPHVMFLNSHWGGDDAEKLRYVAVTRASETLIVLNGVTNKFEDNNTSNPLLRINLKLKNTAKHTV